MKENQLSVLFVLVLLLLYPFSLCTAESGEREVSVKLNGTSAVITGKGASFKKDALKITEGGVYILSGILENGRITIKAPEDAFVELKLDGLTVICSDQPALDIKEAGSVTVTLTDGSENSFTSSLSGKTESTGEAEDTEDDKKTVNAIRSKVPLTIGGNGCLTVSSPDGRGLRCESITVNGGNINILSKDDGIRAKGSVLFQDGFLAIECEKDGIRCGSDEKTEDDGTVLAAEGDLTVTGGHITIRSAEDAVHCSAGIFISGGSVEAVTGGGSEGVSPKMDEGFGRMRGFSWQASEEETASTKGLKADAGITVSGGELILDTLDDALHCAKELLISGGTIVISAGDDGIHSDSAVTVTDGTVTVEKSNEGIEATRITVSGGLIHVHASDDGFNANGGSNRFDPDFGGGFGGGFGGFRGGFGGGFSGGRPGGSGRPGENDRPDNGSQPSDSEATPPVGPGFAPDQQEGRMNGAPPDMNDFEFQPDNTDSESENALPSLIISGGEVHVFAGGDGLDSNGDLIITGGLVTVDGPDTGANGALDSGSENGGSLIVTGGTVLAIGSSGMAECFGEGSEQASIDARISFSAGTELRFCDQNGSLLFTHTAEKSGQSVIFSCPSIKEGDVLTVYAGKSECTATAYTVHASGGFGMWMR